MQRNFLTELFVGLYGAWRFALGDPRAIELYDPRPPAAWRSFFALYLTIPIWVVMGYVWRADAFAQNNLPVIGALLLVTLTQIIAQLAVFFVVFRICFETHRLHRFPVYVNVQNWATLFISLGLLVLGTLSDALHISQITQIPILIAQLLYSYFITRLTLNMSPWPAIGVCAIDIVITIIVNLSGEMAIALSQAKNIATP